MTKSGWGRWCHYLTALVAGALMPLTMAPWNLWPLAVVSVALLAYVLRIYQKTPISAALYYGLGLFGTGASWVFVSIHTYGNADVYLASILTAIFVIGLAVLFALPWHLLRYCSRQPLAFVLGFSSLWLLGEWLRGWLFTGFPWLYLGYGQVDSMLAGWMPLIGVLGVGFLVALTAAPLIFLRSNPSRSWVAIYIAGILLLWCAGPLLKQFSWTRNAAPLTISMVQPDISLQAKWNPNNRQAIIDRLVMLSEEHWGDDLLIWPEAALPLVFNGQGELVSRLDSIAAETSTALITGRLLFQPESGTYFNSLLALGEGSGDYHKRQLVPFGEYVPFENQLRGLIDFFDLPNSVVSPGQSSDPLALGNGLSAAAAICYEIAYADLVARGARDANLIITVSNDAWFGRSIGPEQHLQIARARALENAKPVARATNNGYTALIDADGKMLKIAPRFEAQTLSGTLQLRAGMTPFSRYGQWPMVLMGALLFAVGLSMGRRKLT